VIALAASVLALLALSSATYGAVHWRVMAAAPSIAEPVRLAVAARERLLVPAALASVGGALLTGPQCGAVLLGVAALAGVLDGALSVGLWVAGRQVAPQIARTHQLAGAGALSGPDLLDALRRAREAADRRLHASQHPEA
jgi:hypothetical protein